MSPASSTARAEGPGPVRLVHITTVPITLGFLRGQAEFMRRFGILTEAITSPGAGVAEFAQSESIAVHQLAMTRAISPLRDLVALASLVALLRKLRPHVVHTHTPKAGLLGTIASRLAGVPVTIYHLHGLPLVTATGLKRRLLRWSDQLACRLADSVLCVGPSVRRAAIEHGLCGSDKALVLLAGSPNGVDATGRFNPARIAPESRESVRAELNIPVDALVVGYVGRLVAEKGIRELVEAWKLMSGEREIHLLLVGPFEPQDPLSPGTKGALQSDPRIHLAGLQWDTPRWLSAMDIVVLPSYREGLPVVPLEAGAMGLPVVATDVPGCGDAIEDGVTGTLVPPRDAAGLAQAIARYVGDAALRRTHGAAGRARMLRDFRPEAMWEALLAEYRLLLGSHPRGLRLNPAKRVVDMVATSFLLVILGPIVLATALLVRTVMGGPVLFRQQRPGYLGRPFILLKFRTMRVAMDRNGAPLPDAVRLTPLGRWLRHTSLDELPQLWNVLRGDMSLVGPRPLLPEYLPLYSPVQARRHEVRPGITGWAQVMGRNTLSWETKFALDVWYVDHHSLALDLRILFLTMWQVLRRDGISSAGEATMTKFTGSGA